MPKQKYNAQDVVMACDGSAIYEAKVVNVQETANKNWKYYIHYNGWSRKFDTWVDDNMICKQGDSKALEILKDVLSSKIPKNSDSTKSSSLKKTVVKEEGCEIDLEDEEDSSTSHASVSLKIPSGSNKRASITLVTKDAILAKAKRVKSLAQKDLVDEEEDELIRKFQLPFQLKRYLVDEWSLITQDSKKLLLLPRIMSVENILNEYLDFKHSRLDDEQRDKFRDLFEGLQLYFDKALPTVLLYRQEREQFDKMKERFEDFIPSKIYGGEHLLRLFVKMPRLMTGLVMPSAELNQIMIKFQDFLKFLQKNSSKYLCGADKYVTIEEAYLAISTSELLTDDTGSNEIAANLDNEYELLELN